MGSFNVEICKSPKIKELKTNNIETIFNNNNILFMLMIL